MENKTVLNTMFTNGKNSSLITLKDHKTTFFEQPENFFVKPSKI